MKLQVRINQYSKVGMGLDNLDLELVDVIARGWKGMQLPLKSDHHTFILIQTEAPGCSSALQSGYVSLAYL